MRKNICHVIVISIILFLVTAFFSCKQAVRDNTTLSEDNTQSTAGASETPKTGGLDTVIIERDTTAIDVKESEIAPEIYQSAKPVYSMEMIENKVEGSVKLKLLVGSDGSIKEYIILNDLGHGTNKAIHKALQKMRFTAARKNKKRVSVWIEITLYFKPPKI